MCWSQSTLRSALVEGCIGLNVSAQKLATLGFSMAALNPGKGRVTGGPVRSWWGGHQFKGASEVLILWDMNSNVGGYPKEAVKCKEKRMSAYVHLRNFT